MLDEAGDYKVKRIEVLPRKRLSYQRHSRRAEHWMVVQGPGKVTLDGVDQRVGSHDDGPGCRWPSRRALSPFVDRPTAENPGKQVPIAARPPMLARRGDVVARGELLDDLDVGDPSKL